MAEDPNKTVDDLNDSFASLRESLREINGELSNKINKITDLLDKIERNTSKNDSPKDIATQIK